MPDTGWDLLALSRRAIPAGVSLCAGTLLLPGDCGTIPARCVRAKQVIGFGLSPRDTLTLSSLAPGGRLLCVQRGFFTLGGALIEPQELPLPPGFPAEDEELALLLAGLRLLCDLPLESTPHNSGAL